MSNLFSYCKYVVLDCKYEIMFLVTFCQLQPERKIVAYPRLFQTYYDLEKVKEEFRGDRFGNGYDLN